MAKSYEYQFACKTQTNTITVFTTYAPSEQSARNNLNNYIENLLDNHGNSVDVVESWLQSTTDPTAKR